MPYEFIKTPDEANRFEYETISFKFPSDVSLEDFLQSIERFMKGTGWVFEGTLDFVVDEPPALVEIDDENVSDDSHSV